MKLSVLMILVTGLQCIAANSSGQEKVNLSLKNVPIEQALRNIEQQTKYSFFYKNELLSGRRVRADLQGVTIDQALEELLKGSGLTYQKTGGRLISIFRETEQKAAFSWVLNGKILDVKSRPIAGVSVSIKGKPRGTSTNNDGEFMIEIDSDRDSLVVTAVGYKPQTLLAGSNRNRIIILEEDLEKQKMDEVVVTAFGTRQRKEAVVGSVTTIDPQQLKIPSSNLTTAFAGNIAGMIAYQRSGEPGADNASFFIRGVTTFGYKVDPLVLVDNMEITVTDLARLNVDEIAAFSIMKDATATALYGARGANGVILITTKTGQEGKAKINFRVESKMSAPTRNVELADPVTYMKLNNEAVITRNPLGLEPFSKEKIEKTATAGADPYLYPAVDWRSALLKDNTLNHRLNMSISGGGKVARYFIAGNIAQDNGVLKVPKMNDFNNNIRLTTSSLRINVNVNATKTTELVARLSGTFDDYTGPLSGGADVYNDIMHTSQVLFAPYYPAGYNERFVRHILFGNAGDDGAYANPYADMVKGYKNYSRSNMYAQLELKQQLSAIIPGLSFKAMMNTTRNAYFDLTRQYNPFWYQVTGKDPVTGGYQYELLNEEKGTEYLDYKEGGKTQGSSFYLESSLDYNRTFAQKHNVSALLIYIMRNSLNGNAGSLTASLPFRNLGVSGRATYGFDKRYYVEFNFGYNGSERFDMHHRFGFFPSAGAAWVVSNERFFEGLKDKITNLKIRATYGLVGNDAIGDPANRFFFLSEMNMTDGGRGYSLGQDWAYSKPGISIVSYPNPNITWEVAEKKNLALELSLFGKMNLTAEIYKEHRRNILMERKSIPSTMGLVKNISANVGEATGQGVDLSMDYNARFSGNWWAQARANFTYAASKYLNYEEPDYTEQYRSRIGYSIGQQFGYIADRLFIDDEEVRNSPAQSFGQYAGGDIKYHDVNGDGRITEADQVPIGYPTTPEMVYGFGVSTGNKTLDFSFFFQGSARSSFWVDPKATAPFQANTQLLKVYADNHWSEDNRDIYAIWPRLSPNLIENNTQQSTWFMYNGAFLRLKQVELGYTAPTRYFRRLGVSSFRLYAVVSNIYTWSNFKLWDIEMGSNGLGYPIQRNYSLGLNINF
ncbi:SusC/RagA family TonB-linked outer membrane protein [Niabella drilacis]|uniref:TonB-linked outer membrane protein, SusC/RagA family n=1 Tax=Niabella drilacis (strain DSM 25811 / CCM 8410 / CCUG 62505 / LMG 26954 / E90) TaxID=1285928 RepID=A0A1G6R8P8_NIADE|nr:SusC/RagA family TonB-linked outer membrane protein [Niabella drilacis]SDD00407.1 TonB-linked outer membrane protein, SusC/RagA family [Niabella drilacis]